jgi:hypothetical protein
MTARGALALGFAGVHFDMHVTSRSSSEGRRRNAGESTGDRIVKLGLRLKLRALVQRSSLIGIGFLVVHGFLLYFWVNVERLRGKIRHRHCGEILCSAVTAKRFVWRYRRATLHTFGHDGGAVEATRLVSGNGLFNDAKSQKGFADDDLIAVVQNLASARRQTPSTINECAVC